MNFFGFLLLLGGAGDCGEGVGFMACSDPGFRFFRFLQTMMKIKIRNSKKIKVS